MKAFRNLFVVALLACGLAFPAPLAFQKAAPASTSPTKPSSSAPTQQQIADAKAKGLVWVNTNTHVYHKDGQLYGTTKRGKFMTEDDAKKAGYRLAADSEHQKVNGQVSSK